MPQSGIDHPPLAKIMAPAHGVVCVVAMGLACIHGVIVDAHQNMGSLPIPFFERVDLIHHHKALP